MVNNERQGNSSLLNNEHAQQVEADADDSASVRTSVLLNALLEEGHFDLTNPAGVSQLLQGQVNHSPKLAQLIDDWNRHSQNVDDSNRNRSSNNNSNSNNNNLSSILDDILKRQSQLEEKPKVTTKQLLNSALKICSLYLLSPEQSERYLTNIPDEVRLKAVNLIQRNSRHDPEVFDELKSVSYQFLEIDCFPKFLSTVALHNIHDEISDWRFHAHSTGGNRNKSQASLTEKDLESMRHISKSPFSTYTTLSRIMFGLLWLGVGFWIGYTLIFLKYDRGIRVVTIVPFCIGSYFVVCGLYQVDILYSWFGITQRLLYKDRKVTEDGYDGNVPVDVKESKDKIPFIFGILGGRNRLIEVKHPFIRKFLFQRGLWCCLLVLISTGVFTVVFSCVPGHRCV